MTETIATHYTRDTLDADHQKLADQVTSLLVSYPHLLKADLQALQDAKAFLEKARAENGAPSALQKNFNALTSNAKDMLRQIGAGALVDGFETAAKTGAYTAEVFKIGAGSLSMAALPFNAMLDAAEAFWQRAGFGATLSADDAARYGLLYASASQAVEKDGAIDGSAKTFAYVKAGGSAVADLFKSVGAWLAPLLNSDLVRSIPLIGTLLAGFGQMLQQWSVKPAETFDTHLQNYLGKAGLDTMQHAIGIAAPELAEVNNAFFTGWKGMADNGTPQTFSAPTMPGRTPEAPAGVSTDGKGNVVPPEPHWYDPFTRTWQATRYAADVGKTTVEKHIANSSYSELVPEAILGGMVAKYTAKNIVKPVAVGTAKATVNAVKFGTDVSVASAQFVAATPKHVTATAAEFVAHRIGTDTWSAAQKLRKLHDTLAEKKIDLEAQKLAQQDALKQATADRQNMSMSEKLLNRDEHRARVALNKTERALKKVSEALDPFASLKEHKITLTAQKTALETELHTLSAQTGKDVEIRQKTAALKATEREIGKVDRGLAKTTNWRGKPIEGIEIKAQNAAQSLQGERDNVKSGGLTEKRLNLADSLHDFAQNVRVDGLISTVRDCFPGRGATAASATATSAQATVSSTPTPSTPPSATPGTTTPSATATAPNASAPATTTTTPPPSTGTNGASSTPPSQPSAGASQPTPPQKGSAAPTKSLPQEHLGKVGITGAAAAPLLGGVVNGSLSFANNGGVGDVAKATALGLADGALPGVTSGFANVRENNDHQNWVDQMLNAGTSVTQGVAVGAGIAAVGTSWTGIGGLTCGAIAGISELTSLGLGVVHDLAYTAGISKQGGLITGIADTGSALRHSQKGENVHSWLDSQFGADATPSKPSPSAAEAGLQQAGVDASVRAQLAAVGVGQLMAAKSVQLGSMLPVPADAPKDYVTLRPVVPESKVAMAALPPRS